MVDDDLKLYLYVKRVDRPARIPERVAHLYRRINEDIVGLSDTVYWKYSDFDKRGLIEPPRCIYSKHGDGYVLKTVTPFQDPFEIPTKPKR